MSVQSCAICGTKLDDAFAQRLSKYQRVTFWLDGDAAGVKGRVQAMRTLSLMHQGQVDYIDSPNDPKCYSQEEIEGWLK
jgi:DNA primase